MRSDEKVDGYFDRRAADYAARSEAGLWRRVREAEWAAVREALALEDGQSLLDLGCGAGYYAVRALAHRRVSVFGVDRSQAMMAAFRAQGFPGRCGAIEDFTPERSYDRVLLAGVLEFSREPRALLASAARALEPAGKIVCLVPSAGPVGALYRLAHQARGCPTHIRGREHYLALASALGLRAGSCRRASVLSRAFVLEHA